MAKTTNHELNISNVGTEHPFRLNFKENFEIIDAALGAFTALPTTNKADLVVAILEIYNALKSTSDGTSGADYIGATNVTDLDGTSVQALIESIRNKLKSVTDGSSGGDFVSMTPIEDTGSASTAQSMIEALIALLKGTTSASILGATPVLTGGGNTIQSNMAAIYAQILEYALGNIPFDSITDTKMSKAAGDILARFSAHQAESAQQFTKIDYGRGAMGYGLLDIPSDFPHALPFNLYRGFDGIIKHDWDLSARFETTADQTLYCDSILGDDETGNGSESTPYRSGKKCLQAIKASGNTTFILKVKNSMTRDQVHDSTQPDLPMDLIGKKVYIIADGASRLFMGNVQSSGLQCITPLTWTTDGTAWKTARTNCYNVFDITNKDFYGFGKPLNWVSSAAACQSTANSWYTDGTNVWVHTFDSREPDENLLCGLNTANVWFDITDGELYFKGFDFYSGHPGGVTGNYKGGVFIQGNTASVAVFNDCRFVGGMGRNITDYGVECVSNALAIQDVGKCYSFGCKAGYAYRDGFNYHYYAAVPNKRVYLAFEYNCMGYNTGRYAFGSAGGINNITTCHNGACCLRVGCYGHYAQGPLCADVDDCYSVLYDCSYRDSLNGNDPSCAAYQFNNAAGSNGKAVLINCEGYGTLKYQIYADHLPALQLRRFRGTKFSPGCNITLLD